MRRKVLLADASRTFQFVGISVLSQAALDVVTARDGAEALSKAQVERPDLILMDVAMPVMNGIEVTRRLRLLDGFRKTPILLVSSRTFGPRWRVAARTP